MSHKVSTLRVHVPGAWYGAHIRHTADVGACKRAAHARAQASDQVVRQYRATCAKQAACRNTSRVLLCLASGTCGLIQMREAPFRITTAANYAQHPMCTPRKQVVSHTLAELTGEVQDMRQLYVVDAVVNVGSTVPSCEQPQGNVSPTGPSEVPTRRGT